MKRGQTLKRILQTVCLCQAVVFVCLFLYYYDNKYTAVNPRGMEGTLLLSGHDAEKCTFLTDGWAVYGGVLLTPEDFKNGAGKTPRPDAYVFIGQYGGFEKLIGSPHGSVTYRLIIGVPDESRSYTLALPEIFSSCLVYVNSVERLALGETAPERYRFETGNAAITFDAAERIELLIAVSDFNHLYSGMVYPPAIGAPDAVLGMLNLRFALRAAVCSAALAIGFISFLIGILNKSRGSAVLFGLLCLLFAGYTGYPVTMTLTRGTPFLYAMENFSFCAMLLVVVILQGKALKGIKRFNWPHIFILGLGILAGLAALTSPFTLPYAGLSLLKGFSSLVTAYQWVTAAYITVFAAISVRKKEMDTEPLFFGILILDCTLIMDRILPSFEPIISGWFPELGSFVLVLAVGVTAAREVARQYREKAVAEERMRVILSSGREHYEKMSEMYDRLRIMRHDYKHHLNASLRLLDVGEREEAKKYLLDVESRLLESEIPGFCDNPVIDALLVSYAERFRILNIKYYADIRLPQDNPISNYDMCIVLGNLLENAVTACMALEKESRIELTVNSQNEQLALRVKNSFNGKIISSGGKPLSTKKDGGLGLGSIEAVAARYGGELITEWTGEDFTASVLMRL